MGETTTVRIDRATHEHLRRLARDGGMTVAEAVACGVRLLRQERMGRELAAPPTEDERGWLDAGLQ